MAPLFVSFAIAFFILRARQEARGANSEGRRQGPACGCSGKCRTRIQ